MDRLHVATLNIRNLADRWDERLPLLLADMAALQPDVLGLQEVVFAAQQDRLIGAAGAGHYRTIRGWAGRPEYGNALLLREPLAVDGVTRVELGLSRSATRVEVPLPGGCRVAIVVTHLHHPGDAEAERDEQVATLVAWLGEASLADATIVMGDFNADPTEPAYRRMTEAGFRSSYLEANGEEPAVTWPSGIQAPGMDTDGVAECLDYIWLTGAVAARSARLVFDRPAADDPTLYPSDHIGIATELVFGAEASSAGGR